MEPDEIWRPVVGFEGYYSVSDQGRVRREKSVTFGKLGHILATPDRGNGYLVVSLCRDGRKRNESVHRVVAAAFIGPADGQEVNHINGVKSDNRLVNLEYVTSSENQHHVYRTGLQSAKGERNGQAKLGPDDVRAIRASATGGRGESAEFAQQYGVSEATIRDVLKRRTWPDLM